MTFPGIILAADSENSVLAVVLDGNHSFDPFGSCPFVCIPHVVSYCLNFVPFGFCFPMFCGPLFIVVLWHVYPGGFAFPLYVCPL